MEPEHPATNVFVPARGRSRTRLREDQAGRSGDRSRGSKPTPAVSASDLDASRSDLPGFLSRHGRIVAVVIGLVATVAILMSLFPSAPNIRDLLPRDAVVEDNVGVFSDTDEDNCPVATRQMLDGEQVVKLDGWTFVLQGKGESEPGVDGGRPAVRTRLYIAERDVRVVAVMVSNFEDGGGCLRVNYLKNPKFAMWLITWLGQLR